MSKNPFAKWLREVAEDNLVINQNNINDECQSNLWSFSLTPEQIEIVSVSDVQAFIDQIIKSRSNQLISLGYEPESAIFYCWHDELAGQLLFSIVSASHGSLPFRAKLDHVTDIQILINEWLDNSPRGLIPWENLEDQNSWNLEEDEESTDYILNVWSVKI